jgi:glycosyltransferase involved in cell wall biosynthesis
MNIVYVYADNPQEWNCSEWRCAVPARAFNRTHRHRAALVSIAEFASNSNLSQQACEAAEVIVVQRNLIEGVLPAIQHWKAHDKVVVADFDDAYNLMQPSNPAYLFWTQGMVREIKPDGEIACSRLDPPPLTQFKWGLRLVHAATVPSTRLASDWQAYAEMHYLPNYIDLEKYQNVSPEPHDGVVIGWGGSTTHLESFTGSGVLEALKHVCQMRPQVKVIIGGGDTRLLKQLTIPDEQKIHQPWISYSEWAHTLAKYDIGLAPLHGPYDERRSWIKALEYMVMKIPWVASEGAPYQELRPYGWLVKNSVSAWEHVLLDMVDHLDDYKSLALREPFLFGISQSIDENIEKMLSVYKSITHTALGDSPGMIIDPID